MTDVDVYDNGEARNAAPEAAGHTAITDDLRADLISREPLFHRRDVIWDEASFEAEVARDFREIGASGRCYERADVKETVLGRLAGTHEDSLHPGFEVRDAEVVPLCDDLVQVRYTLLDVSRVTRRSTLYRRTPAGAWQLVFHQGTVVEDRATPSTESDEQAEASR